MALISHLCQSHFFYSYFMVPCAFISFCNQLMSTDVTSPLLAGDSETRIKAKTKLLQVQELCQQEFSITGLEPVRLRSSLSRTRMQPSFKHKQPLEEQIVLIAHTVYCLHGGLLLWQPLKLLLSSDLSRQIEMLFLTVEVLLPPVMGASCR